MAAKTKNPFETLGITPEMAHRLDDKDLFTLIRASYRTLQKVYHPDRSQTKSTTKAAKNAANAVEINLAYEQLNLEKDLDAFRRIKKRYAARREKGLSSKIKRLEKKVAERDYNLEHLADGFMAYIRQGLPWTETDPEATAGTPLKPSNIKLGLNDVAINQNVRGGSWSMGSNYKEIVFDALGDMYYRPVGRSRPDQVRYIHLVGVIDIDAFDLIPVMDRVTPRQGFFKSPALDSRYGIDGAPLQVENSMSLKNFKKYCLPLLQPELAERSYLFSIHRPLFEAQQRITVEGVIVKITRI
jgi:curved DNA-binding protein CbpA